MKKSIDRRCYLSFIYRFLTWLGYMGHALN